MGTVVYADMMFRLMDTCRDDQPDSAVRTTVTCNALPRQCPPHPKITLDQMDQNLLLGRLGKRLNES